MDRMPPALCDYVFCLFSLIIPALLCSAMRLCLFPFILFLFLLPSASLLIFPSSIFLLLLSLSSSSTSFPLPGVHQHEFVGTHPLHIVQVLILFSRRGLQQYTSEVVSLHMWMILANKQRSGQPLTSGLFMYEQTLMTTLFRRKCKCVIAFTYVKTLYITLLNTHKHKLKTCFFLGLHIKHNHVMPP